MTATEPRVSATPSGSQRTARALRKIEDRIQATAATVRFEEDGPVRRVEIVVSAARNRRLVAKAEGRYFGPTVNVVIDKLMAQARAAKRVPRSAARKAARA